MMEPRSAVGTVFIASIRIRRRTASSSSVSVILAPPLRNERRTDQMLTLGPLSRWIDRSRIAFCMIHNHGNASLGNITYDPPIKGYLETRKLHCISGTIRRDGVIQQFSLGIVQVDPCKVAGDDRVDVCNNGSEDILDIFLFQDVPVCLAQKPVLFGLSPAIADKMSLLNGKSGMVRDRRQK